MNEEQKQMLDALIQNCETNIQSANNEFEALAWDNMKDGLLYIQNGGKSYGEMMVESE